MHSTIDIQAIATTELNYYLEAQSHEIAPEPADPIAAGIRLLKHRLVREVLVVGEYYWQAKQSFKKLKDFKVWLEKQKFPWKDACKNIKMYETFADFSLSQIGYCSIDTLSALCQPKYKELLEQLRSLPKWADTKIQELMKLVREQKKVGSRKPEVESKEKDGSGWRRLKTGGRVYQLPILHEDWLGTLIEQVREIKNQNLTQIIKEMALFFVERGRVPGISLRGLEIPATAVPVSSNLASYNPYARGLKATAQNTQTL